MKINLHIPINFPMAACVIAIVGMIFTGYIYVTAESIISDISSNGIVSHE